MAICTSLTTDQYIQQFIAEKNIECSKKESQSMRDYLAQNPLLARVVEASGGVLGTTALVTLPLSLPVIGVGAIVAAVVGGVVATVSLVANQILDFFIYPHHDMNDHVFSEGKYGAATLRYQGDVPVLELEYDNPYNAGFGHGYLLGKNFDQLLGKMFIVKQVLQMKEASDMPKTMERIKELLSPEYLEEMEGIVDGYNAWVKENTLFGSRNLTIDDLMIFHLMPDSLHFSPEEAEKKLTTEKELPVGCTVVIDKDNEQGITFARNMDWPSFGVFGKYSLMINRKYSTQEKLSTLEVGFPGFVGTLTGMNKKGLSLAMNVCSGETKDIKGVPAAFYNRMCLENCKDVQSVARLIKSRAPLGSYHLSAADQTSAISFHFFQGSKKAHVIREWTKGKAPLITTNCNYISKDSVCGNMHHSEERKAIIQDLFNQVSQYVNKNEIKRKKLLEATLELPYVNNSLTVHRVLMCPQTKKMKVAFDNSFAGGLPLHEVDTATLLA